MNKKLYYIILVIIGLGLISLAVWAFMLKAPRTVPEPSVPITAVYGNKIVYTTDQSADIDRLKDDCRERSGEFNECGNVCGPEDEICAQVCAFTCEFGESATSSQYRSESGEGSAPESWNYYKNEDIGVEFFYPPELDIKEEGERSADLTLWGPTQREGTELYDGISLTIERKSFSDRTAYNLYVRDNIEEAEMLGEVVKELRETAVSGIEGETYTARTLGEYTKIFLPAPDAGSAESGENYEVIIISYSAPDPTGQGYEETVNEILATLRASAD